MPERVPSLTALALGAHPWGMRFLVLVALFAIGCGSIEDAGDPQRRAADYGNCPDLNATGFEGYPCDPTDQGDGSNWICGVVDMSKPQTPMPTFIKRDNGCYAYAIDLVTRRNCVAVCP